MKTMDRRGYLLTELAVSLGIGSILALILGGALIFNFRFEAASASRKTAQERAYWLKNHLIATLAELGSPVEISEAAPHALTVRSPAKTVHLWYRPEEAAVYEQVSAPTPGPEQRLLNHVSGFTFTFYDRSGAELPAPVVLSKVSRVSFRFTVDAPEDREGEYELAGSWAVKTPQRGG